MVVISCTYTQLTRLSIDLLIPQVYTMKYATTPQLAGSDDSQELKGHRAIHTLALMGHIPNATNYKLLFNLQLNNNSSLKYGIQSGEQNNSDVY